MDLGSGLGKAVFAAHLYFQFGVCKGIEFLDELHHTASSTRTHTPAEIRPGARSHRAVPGASATSYQAEVNMPAMCARGL